jgi:hypothetical protein
LFNAPGFAGGYLLNKRRAEAPTKTNRNVAEIEEHGAKAGSQKGC